MKGGHPYYYPVGFIGIGLSVKYFDENTCVAYHGVRLNSLPSILRDGFKLPSESTGVKKFVIRCPTIFDISNFANAIFVSPSIKYASFYGINKGKYNHKNIQIIVLQCRVKPNSYTVHPNTTYYDVNDPHYNNDIIEWRIANPKNIYWQNMIKVNEFHVKLKNLI